MIKLKFLMQLEKDKKLKDKQTKMKYIEIQTALGLIGNNNDKPVVQKN